MLVWKTVVPFWGNTHGKYRILSQEHRCFRSKEREKAGLTVPPPWSAVCSEQTNCGSCSPHGWASCLLGMLGAFLSGALSAEAGLYLRSLCQGEYSDRAKLVKKLLLNLTLCGLTQCTTMLCWKANCKLWSKMWQKHFFLFLFFLKEWLTDLEERHNTKLCPTVNQWEAELNHTGVIIMSWRTELNSPN